MWNQRYGKSASIAAMQEFRTKSKDSYGTCKYLGQTYCDFIDDKTCVSVSLVEASGEKEEKGLFRSVASKSSGMLCVKSVDKQKGVEG